MIYLGFAALRHMLASTGPILWDGRVITRAEAEAVLLEAGRPPDTATKVIPTLQQPTEAMIAARIAACTTCEYYRKESDKCGICGCGAIVSQRSKSPLGSCPKGKWDQ